MVNWEPLDSSLGEFEIVVWWILVGTILFAAGLIYFISRRHNWARIVFLVLTVIGIGMYLVLPPELSIEAAWSIAVIVGTTVMDVVAIYWLFSGSGAEWFTARKTG